MGAHPLQVARCTKIIPVDPKKAEAARAVNPAGAAQGQKGADEQDKYVINIKQIAKFVVGLSDRVAPTDIEEGMRVGCVEPFMQTNDNTDISAVWTGINTRFRYHCHPRLMLR